MKPDREVPRFLFANLEVVVLLILYVKLLRLQAVDASFHSQIKARSMPIVRTSVIRIFSAIYIDREDGRASWSPPRASGIRLGVRYPTDLVLEAHEKKGLERVDIDGLIGVVRHAGPPVRISPVHSRFFDREVSGNSVG